MWLATTIAAVTLAWTAAATAQPAKPAKTPKAPTTFVAKARDFANYRSWDRMLVQPHKLRGGPHPSAPQLLYIQPLPPVGAAVMPVGTKIVKERTDGLGPVFAMVKRSRKYKASQMGGWELFGLTLSARDLTQAGAATGPAKVKVLWRGLGAPQGNGYDEHDTSCQICHNTAYKNDRLLSPGLTLPWQGLPK
jgi:hypothetical protein